MSEHEVGVHVEPASETAFDLTRSDATAAILQRYSAGMGSVQTKALARVLASAVAAGANTVLVESNYIDHDWRSELSAFYTKSFRGYQGVTDRLHFLALADGESVKAIPVRLAEGSLDYVGYSVMRPLPWAPVGRTMLRPPQTLTGKVQCLATDEVHLHGARLQVTGTPFISQDSQLSRCAHAVAWQAAYLHHLRFASPRVTSASIAQSAALDSAEARPVPSSGLGVVAHDVGDAGPQA